MSASHEIVVIIRPSFMKFCNDGCRAALFNHALYWIAKKARGESKEKVMQGEIYWYAKTEDIVKGLADAWCEKKVRQEVNNLVEMGLLGRTKDPVWGANRTKHFFFGQEQCKKLLDLCEEHKVYIQQIDLNEDVLHLVNMLFANGQYAECKWSIYQMPQENRAQANGKYTGAITKGNTKDTYKGEEDSNKSLNGKTVENNPSPPPQEKNVLQEKVKMFRQNFIELGKEMFEYPKFTVSLPDDGSKIYTTILKLITAELDSPEDMRYAFMGFWNEREKDGSHWWRDPLRLTFKAYVNHYQKYHTSGRFKSVQSNKPTSNAPTNTQTGSTTNLYDLVALQNKKKQEALAKEGVR